MKIHDYTKRYWGHDFAILDIEKEGQVIEASGWGLGLDKGDYVLFPNDESSTRYKIKKIRYTLDPQDMWFATMKFAPRKGLTP